MIPILYDPSTENSDGHILTTTDGIGRLTGCTEAYCAEERNGAYEIEINIPCSTQYAEYIEEGYYIGCSGHKGSGRQLFEIYEVSKSADNMMNVLGKHISYRLAYIPVKPFTLTGTIQQILNTAASATYRVEDCPFTFSVDSSLTATKEFKIEEPTSLGSLLSDDTGMIFDLFSDTYEDLDIEWDNYTIRITNGNRGSDNGVELRRGKNITDLTAKGNILEVTTGCLPYYKDSDGNITYGNVQYSTNANDYPYKRTVSLDCSSEIDTSSSTSIFDQLNAKGQEYLDEEMTNLEREIAVSFVDLSLTQDYKSIQMFEDIGLCDTIKVIYPTAYISYTARVEKLKWNILQERNEEVEVGKVKKGVSTKVKNSYLYITDLVKKSVEQQQINNNQETINYTYDQRITGQAARQDSTDSNVDNLQGRMNTSETLDTKINSYFHFGDTGLDIYTESSDTITRYTNDGFKILGKQSGNVIATADSNEFNCNQGLGISNWHMDQFSDPNIFIFSHKV